MAAKVLFVDRDGTLIEEPADNQVDSVEKVRLVPGVIPALLELKSAGYEFVIVSNQDGLDTDAFPREHFEPAREHMLALFNSQGIDFAEEFYCPHLDTDACECRKPRAGLLTRYLATTQLDLAASAVV
ncbi:MAG: histidinol-phosphatase, partial [Gammaproteobacteria bacterium]|nr:histidinol-phosphatase [Gammaproteobacteria bacterium]